MIVDHQVAAAYGLHQDVLVEYIGKHGALAGMVKEHVVAADVTILEVQAAEHIMLK